MKKRLISDRFRIQFPVSKKFQEEERLAEILRRHDDFVDGKQTDDRGDRI